ncbi:hypothetical protein NHX12_033884 [Muraenolepis orangiensis]|uniref:Uncharacterized protein n=1 Tax=Muraenolepis orangiensis TaxID=630683 RepID=A0A9Q0E6U9_9TELE|nr:hypothetical protein NHX12_033884 [Muraenolepis orangiensis]
MITKSPTIDYWDTILNMEILKLIFVRVTTNYAQWIPVHIRDMESLPTSIHKEFEEHGHWVVPKTTNRFSSKR